MKRYDLQWTTRCGVTFEELTESDDGEWMRFEDHERLLTRLAELREYLRERLGNDYARLVEDIERNAPQHSGDKHG